MTNEWLVNDKQDKLMLATRYTRTTDDFSREVEWEFKVFDLYRIRYTLDQGERYLSKEEILSQDAIIKGWRQIEEADAKILLILAIIDGEEKIMSSMKKTKEILLDQFQRLSNKRLSEEQ